MRVCVCERVGVGGWSGVKRRTCINRRGQRSLKTAIKIHGSDQGIPFFVLFWLFSFDGSVQKLSGTESTANMQQKPRICLRLFSFKGPMGEAGFQLSHGRFGRVFLTGMMELLQQEVRVHWITQTVSVSA